MEYSDAVREHFAHPRNVGVIADADGVGEFGDPGCGDAFRVYIKVTEGRVSDIRFQIQGCPSAIACGSVLTEMARGKPLDEALRIRNEDVLIALGGLPDPKEHCSNLGAEALHRAIFAYLGRIAPRSASTFWVGAIGEVTRVAEVSDGAPPGFPRLSEVAVFPRFLPGLEGVERHTHLWVAYWMHELAEGLRDQLSAHPMGDAEQPAQGVFALRSPIRPNPVGFTLVRLVERREGRLLVDGLDARVGSPVLDLKPWSEKDLPGTAP